MNTANEISGAIIWILVGFWVLHVVRGTGGNWIKSFFSNDTGKSSGTDAIQNANSPLDWNSIIGVGVDLANKNANSKDGTKNGGRKDAAKSVASSPTTPAA